MLGLIAAAWGCKHSSTAAAPPAARDAARAAAPADARAPDAALAAARPGGAPPLAYPAVRCSECHEKMFDEWKDSAHAQAKKSPLYARMHELAGDASCDRCHAPLAARVGNARVVDEGVTCEVCHTIDKVDVTTAGAGFKLRLGEQIKFGPLCDAKDHYFHRMGCSPLHAKAEVCAACHLYVRTAADGTQLPIYTAYEEWHDEYKNPKIPCQHCHMPGGRAEVATGAGERAGVPHHGLLGTSADLRKHALAATATVRVQDGKALIDVTIRNKGAGHRVPTGSPDRRIVVRATAGDGGPSAEHAFGRFLVDASGQPAPWYRATRLASDQRIPPKGSATAHLELDAGSAHDLELVIEWQAMDREIASQAHLTDVPVIPLLHARVPLGGPQSHTVELR